jgi:hypothetical protein
MSNNLIELLIEKATSSYEKSKLKIEQDKIKKIEKIKTKPLETMDYFFEQYFENNIEKNCKFSKETGADDYILIKKRLVLLDKTTKLELECLAEKFEVVIAKIKSHKYVEKSITSDDDYASLSEDEDEEEYEDEE